MRPGLVLLKLAPYSCAQKGLCNENYRCGDKRGRSTLLRRNVMEMEARAAGRAVSADAASASAALLPKLVFYRRYDSCSWLDGRMS